MIDFFGPGSPYLSHPLLTLERTRAEVDRILALIGTEPTDVLDVGCGFGRHSIEFASRGMRVVGVDPSATMLAEAQARADAAGVEVDLRRMRAQDVDDREVFDLATCLYTTLGQIADAAVGDESDRFIESVVGSLRPGASLVVEVPDRERTISGLVAHEQLGGTEVTRGFDPELGRVHERFAADERVHELAYRVFSRVELETLLRGFDLEIVTVLDEALVMPPANLVTVVARRT